MGPTDADRPNRRTTRPISPGGLLAVVLALGLCWGCASAGSAHGASADASFAAGPDSRPADVPAGAASAVFAGGCFWCVEAGFDKAHVDGIYEAESGYTGGDVERPTYEQVSSGGTGHVESVRVWYDPKKVGYDRLLDIFWRLIDPTDDGGQFADRGSQYRTAIFVADAAERSAAEASKKRMEASGRFDGPIVTEIRDAGPFWPAETYHQDYDRKHPAQYKAYRYASGRTPYLERIWGPEADESDHDPATDPAPADWRSFTMPDDATLHDRLSDLQYRVTQQEGTEPPFDNEYWDNHAAGLYVDVVSGEPLFSSKDKYDSGTGWPSFIKPIAPDNVVEKVDRNLGMARTEVRSKRAGSHLGHVFNDGPAPTGLRYCMNSAALRFIPVDDLEKEGYGEYRKLFD